MAPTVVPLRWTASDRPSVRLGGLTGAAELAVGGYELDSAIALLDALLIHSGDHDVVAAADLATPDRDRVFAALLDRLVGDRIESTVRCRSCGELFELSFSLAALLEHRGGFVPTDVVAVSPGRWALDGTTFRFPTGHDEQRARDTDNPAVELRARCLGFADPSGDTAPADTPGDAAVPTRVEEAMAAMAPVLATEIGGECPECGETHAVTFDVQQYTTTLVRLGREQLLRDIHVIASAYGWSRTEILELDRAERRVYSDLIGARRRAGVRP
ncbi:MAG: hypothetical protein GY713_11635 [Actinomycetia bacterium]|nr:hypothetical protein [Actinomycetes bacterium]